MSSLPATPSMGSNLVSPSPSTGAIITTASMGSPSTHAAIAAAAEAALAASPDLPPESADKQEDDHMELDQPVPNDAVTSELSEADTRVEPAPPLVVDVPDRQLDTENLANEVEAPAKSANDSSASGAEERSDLTPE